MTSPAPKPVVVGVDGSESDEQVVAWGAHEAHRRQTRLLIAHARDVATPSPVSDVNVIAVLSEAKEYGAELLADAQDWAHAAQPGIDVATLMRQQKPEELLVELSVDAELLVVGTHGVSRFVGALLGSVSQRLAAHARCPVVVLPPPGLPHSSGSANVVVVGVSPSPGGMAALRFAVAEAQVRGADVLAVRCWDEPARYGMGSAGVGFISPLPFETARDSEQAVLERCLRSLRAEYPTVKIRSQLVESAADVALVDFSREADLLVVGCRHEDGHHLSRLGPISSWLLHNCAAPIAVVGYSRDHTTS